jgi:hypothetical protein
MKKDADLFRKVLESYGAKVGAPPAEYVRWLTENKISEEMANGFTRYCLRKNTGVGAITFYSTKDIMSINAKGGIPLALNSGFVIVGTCPNGDPVAIDVADHPGTVGYLSHEEMWSVENLRTVFRPVASSLGKLAEGLRENQIPLDYFEVKEST